MTADERQDRATFILTLVLNFLLVLITLVKGKVRMAVIGTLIPFVAIVGAVRLARPGSWWSRRLYARRHRTRARSAIRAYRHDKRWTKVRRRLQDVIGGFQERVPGRGTPPSS